VSYLLLYYLYVILIYTRPDLTVEEHIRIFSDLKCLSKVNKEIVNELANGVDLQNKLKKKAKTLSGGQKRKLQMAIMFAGGSAVCCVDEVSTGLDPISRRRIWEILLAERARRTIILTTHYLDEADFLADDIAIMFKGSLRASGTSASLKHTHGDGYTIKLPHHSDLELEVSGEVHREHSRHQTVYRVATAALAAELVGELEKHGLDDYQLSGPTMEELFIKVTGETIHSIEETSEEEKAVNTKDAKVIIDITETEYSLTEGKPISVYKQWGILLCKRLRILKRRYIPYFIAVAFAIVGAGIAPLLIKSIKEPLKCPVAADLINDRNYRSDFGSSFYSTPSSNQGSYVEPDIYKKKYVFGPASKLDDKQLELLVSTYSENYTYNYPNSYSRYGYHNTTELRDTLLLVDTYDEFRNAIQNNWKTMADFYSGSSYPTAVFTTLRGGVWMGDDGSKPTVLVRAQTISSPNQMLNVLNVMKSGVKISGSYYSFASTQIPELIEMAPLMFIIYYGLIMAW
jgi:ATP-binding cassette subfamily A (ABC1) protein 3